METPKPEPGGRLYAGIETGGAKILCRVEDADGRAVADGRWPTQTPAAALEAIGGLLAEAAPAGALAAIGLAAFGPLVVDPASPEVGRVLATPKTGWRGANLAAALGARFGAPVAVDTDVNAAALAEQLLGAGRGAGQLAYVTVGTGIGGGLCINGGTLKGAPHPEIGHVRLVRAAGDGAASACPFHADCAEGLASGPAIARRLADRSASGARLADDPDLTAMIADYLAQLLAVLTLAWSPHRIVLGGGVMTSPGLREQVSDALAANLGDYGAGAGGPGFVAAPQFEHSGLEGALLMARRVAGQEDSSDEPRS